jgi:hypothetical protein
MNVGLWQDLALQNFVPPLRRAIAGSLNPDAPTWQAKASNHLLAIRAGLRDILIARDAVYRLIRSDGLPLRRRPSFPSDQDQPEAGARGNDLMQLLAYHTVAALNLAYSISDNMMLILRWKTGLAETGKHSRGFTKELIEPRKPLRQVAMQLLKEDSCSRLIALREVRNRWIHEAFVLHGRLLFHPTGTRFPEMSVIWLEKDDYRPEHWATLRGMSRIAMDDAAVVTFDGLMDHLWTSTVATLEAVLGLIEWSDDRWLLDDEAWRDYLRSYAGWDRALHRAFWGLPRGLDMSTKSRKYIAV